MISLAIYLRFMQMFAHAAHNLVSGPSFFEDHDFFGDAYVAHDADYDAVVERTIGLWGAEKVDFAKIATESALMLSRANLKGSYLAQQLEHEKDLCQAIDMLCKHEESNQGLVQLLGNMADASQVRQYKLKQRLA